MKKLLFFIFLLFTVNANAEQVCWGINEKIKYFPTIAEVDTFIASLPSPKYTDKIDFNRSGQPEQGGGTIYWDQICYSVVCGDAFCDGSIETCTSCPQDCGTCDNPSESCGNGVCATTENCLLCESDCGVCPPPPPPSEWTYCCAEWETCNFTGKREVRYGANGVYNYGTYDNSVLCVNSIFGDPLVGTLKKCEYGSEIMTCVTDGSCDAPTPLCGKTTNGGDNCGFSCTKTGEVCPPEKTFITITAFEKWLTTTSIKGADIEPIIKWIKVGTSPNYKYYKVTIEKVVP